MFDYLQQFNNLPKDLRDQVSSPSVMTAISELESKYRVDLAMTVMKVMIKGLAVKNLPTYFISENGLSQPAAAALSDELKTRVFSGAANYLGLAAEKRALDLDQDISGLIREAGLILASENLVSRFKNIIGTYLRGVRDKIDTRNSLMKDVKIGGLNLSPAETERVLKICENIKLKTVSAVVPTAPAAALGGARVNPTEEYDLKQSLAVGQTKVPLSAAAVAPVTRIATTSGAPFPTLDTKHELAAPDQQLDLPAAAPKLAPVVNLSSLTPETSVKPQPIIPVTADKTKSAVAPAVSIPPASRLAPLKAAGKTILSPAVVSRPPVAKPGVWSKFGLFKPAVKPEVADLTSALLSGAPNLIPKSVSPASSPAASRPAPAVSPSRPQMHDVKPMPKVMGPIEELQFFDLVNFRRLGRTPAEITAKIFVKIKLLERDGYDKMVAGVKAWRQSPVNRLYLRLGQEAVAKGQTLKDYVAARQQTGEECLSLEEIEALVSLNGKLSF